MPIIYRFEIIRNLKLETKYRLNSRIFWTRVKGLTGIGIGAYNVGDLGLKSWVNGLCSINLLAYIRNFYYNSLNTMLGYNAS